MGKYKIPTLTIAGSDSSGGAGIQADLKTFSAIGTYGMSVITAITAQSTQGVFLVEDLSKEIIKKQIEVVFDDIPPKAVKIGMVSSPEIIRVIVEALDNYNPKNLVVDPVMISKSGYSLLKPEAKENLIKYLIPKAYILTPNTLEAEEIAGIKINNLDDMKLVGEKILGLGPNYVLMKGGHLDGDAIDVLIGKDTFEIYKSERLDMKNTHGTGCTLSSAITAYLALGLDVKEAVLEAKKYITNAIKYSFDIGKGVGPVHHFYKFDLNK
ncbi:bifunctional hydroxymethylpyrimidine kinase/phosphomethylpyrimidine kinase [Paraclostridium sordellii]|uniref:bifunctional hydroxymethylpyrimidine kinase/phosphomethylpyrimidine kinase n=1 Tax=Paraclostridium sordellii TaxID=1505 RepID=UPI0005429277|nr:bifunctional hydroxymethylpyrimidine kinase/phosphomethylpyrimidine kinase [Paeniclostridium sordellii]CEK35048.1 phosphomethylpyrimidine kinase,Hydroxymethylpyrimidine/phosphomethylpyrimidine kinase,bifunctional hydroxy-methylpyrimidine kinase/ hydroxy-phosphomethylpyrimidine kinase,Thiamine monophosphate synthase,phosphomethylpyrimidine kinase,Phosphomethylpyrimidine kinase [[Clostridium] sordellii] [Paeniclostridium sordellii]CEO06235.1 phosphomethylpyrimidine kinase [[Clostridium] sordelli